VQNCPNCGTQLPTDAMFCTSCGHQIPSAPSGKPEATGGKLPNKEIMKQAKEALKGHWGLAIGTIVVFYLVTIAVSIIPYIGWLGSLLISGPMSVGISIFSLAISRKQETRLSQIFEGFHTFGVALRTYLLYCLFVLLWALLLIIPGIIAAIAYSQAFYILADDDHSNSARAALRESKQMMQGNKWKYVCLNLRFTGWALLCILTLGIGFLWLIPYVAVSLARFYDDVAGEQDVITAEAV